MLIALWIIAGILASGLFLEFLDDNSDFIIGEKDTIWKDRVFSYTLGLIFGPIALVAAIVISLGNRSGFKFW